MIFALWAARPGTVSPEDVQELSRAAQVGLGIRTELAQRFAAQRGGDPERYRRYLTQRIRYGLGPYELQGLEAFLAKAAQKGFLPPMQLRFVEDRLRTARTRRAVSLDAALQKAADGGRLDPDEAEVLDEKAPLLELGLAADQRRRVHGDSVSPTVSATFPANVCDRVLLRLLPVRAHMSRLSSPAGSAAARQTVPAGRDRI
jgi:cyclic dehypoxanthinyl futalosine synthase